MIVAARRRRARASASSTPAPAWAASRRTWRRSPATRRASTPPTSSRAQARARPPTWRAASASPSLTPIRCDLTRSDAPLARVRSRAARRAVQRARRLAPPPRGEVAASGRDVPRARRPAGAHPRRAGAAGAPGRRARLLGVHVHRRGGRRSSSPASSPRHRRASPSTASRLRTWPHRDDADALLRRAIRARYRVAASASRSIRIAPVDPQRRLRPSRRGGARGRRPPAPTTCTSTSWTATSSPTSPSARWSSPPMRKATTLPLDVHLMIERPRATTSTRSPRPAPTSSACTRRRARTCIARVQQIKRRRQARVGDAQPAHAVAARPLRARGRLRRC